MAGTVSLYGAVPEGEKRPQRVQTRYASHMPEEQAPTFKEKFEAVVRRRGATGARHRQGADPRRGALPIWKYAETSKRFDGYEKTGRLLAHAGEHLSLAAEALCSARAPRKPMPGMTSMRTSCWMRMTGPRASCAR